MHRDADLRASNLFRGGITHPQDAQPIDQMATGQWMIAIDRELAAVDASYAKRLAFTAIVLHLDFRTQPAELWWHVFDRVRIGQLWPTWTEPLFGANRNAQLIALAMPCQRVLDLFNQPVAGTVHVAHRQVDLFEHASLFVENAVHELDETMT